VLAKMLLEDLLAVDPQLSQSADTDFGEAPLDQAQARKTLAEDECEDSVGGLKRARFIAGVHETMAVSTTGST
jgi:hypothetical protein